MVAAKTPTIAAIKNNVSEADIRALLTIAVCEVCEFFNVGKNMSDAQVAMTVDLIIERFWYFKMEEIKYCFRRAMMNEKLFDRLDGNIIIGWLSQYDAERTEEAMRISDQEASQTQNETRDAPDAISFDQYLAKLREQAVTDKNAAGRLSGIERMQSAMRATDTAEERAKKDHDFKLWRTFDYLYQKNK